MPTLRSNSYDPLRDFRFIVSFPGEKAQSRQDIKLGFSKISGLNLGTSDVIEYREGNEIISPRKIPGLNKYDNITFERGRANDPGNTFFLEDWREKVAHHKGGYKGNSPDGINKSSTFFRKKISVSVVNRDGHVATKFVLYDAWPVSLKYSDLDSQNSGLLISTLEVAIEGLVVF